MVAAAAMTRDTTMTSDGRARSVMMPAGIAMAAMVRDQTLTALAAAVSAAVCSNPFSITIGMMSNRMAVPTKPGSTVATARIQ